MVISFIHPHTCGFAKVVAWSAIKLVVGEITKRDTNESPTQYETRKMQRIFDVFQENFHGNPRYEIDFKTFREKLPDLRKKISKWNSRKIDARQRYLETFSCEKWRQLGSEQKAEHSLMNCKGCVHRYVEISLFPVSSQQFVGSTETNPVCLDEAAPYAAGSIRQD